MLTYQDFAAAGGTETARQEFLLRAVEEHRGSRAVKDAETARRYYNGENPTIARYEKILYDLRGRAHRDLYAANHKIASSFFRVAVDQQTMYLLGNGVTFRRADTADMLGESFDRQLQRLGECALVEGMGYGFWNCGRLEVFRRTEFVPFWDEESGRLRAGLRYWRLGAGRPLRLTLFEEDGLTDYVQTAGGTLTVLREKRSYLLKTDEDGEVVSAENWNALPVIPLKNGDEARSELAGRRNTIDALDLCTSNLVNNVDEGNLIYWVLVGCGGMDDLDDAKFVERLRTTHVAHADGDDGSASVSAHTLEAPFEGTQSAIDVLTRRLYADFRAFDSAAVTAGSQTATAIKASYVPLDLKTDVFERQVSEFIAGLLALLGLRDRPAYTRNRVVNVKEEAETVLLGRDYLDRDYIRRKLLTLLGDGDLS